MGKPYEQFGPDWEKEMMKGTKQWLISQLRAEWVAKNNLPLGDQKAPVLVGRLKDSLNVIVQCDSKFIEIPAEWVRDVALGIIMVANEDARQPD